MSELMSPERLAELKRSWNESDTRNELQSPTAREVFDALIAAHGRIEKLERVADAAKESFSNDGHSPVSEALAELEDTHESTS